MYTSRHDILLPLLQIYELKLKSQTLSSLKMKIKQHRAQTVSKDMLLLGLVRKQNTIDRIRGKFKRGIRFPRESASSDITLN